MLHRFSQNSLLSTFMRGSCATNSDDLFVIAHSCGRKFGEQDLPDQYVPLSMITQMIRFQSYQEEKITLAGRSNYNEITASLSGQLRAILYNLIQLRETPLWHEVSREEEISFLHLAQFYYYFCEDALLAASTIKDIPFPALPRQ